MDPQIWRAIAARANDIQSTFQPDDMSFLLNSFARLKYRERTLMDNFAQQAYIQLPKFTTPNLCYFLSAYASLGVQKPLLLKLSGREVARRSHELDSRQLAMCLGAFAKFRFYHPPLMDVLRQRIAQVNWSLKHTREQFKYGIPIKNPRLQERDRHLNQRIAKDLTLVMTSLTRLGVEDQELFSFLAQQVSRNLVFFEAKALSLVAHAFGKMRLKNTFLMEVLGDEIFAKRKEFNPQGIGLVLNAYINTFCWFFSICLGLSFCVRSMLRLSSLERNMKTNFYSPVRIQSSRSRISTQWWKNNRYTRLNIQNDVLFEYYLQELPQRMPQTRSRWTVQSLCLLLTSYSRRYNLQTPVEPLFKQIGDALALQGPQLYPRALVMATTSFAYQGLFSGFVISLCIGVGWQVKTRD